MNLLQRSVAFLILLMIAVACRQQTLSPEDVNVDIAIADSVVGETIAVVTVTDTEGNPIDKLGSLSLRGDMSHAGMLPVLRESDESTEGVFTVPFEWTMGGTWMVEVTLTLESGDVITESFDFEITNDDGDMGDMKMDSDEDDHSTNDMDHSTMDMGGETSAVYMSITNNGEETVTITGAQSSVAHLAELHETVVENDIARMQPVEALVINAGDMLDLMPGRIHIMLIELTQDIVADEEIEVSLTLESGDKVQVMALVQDMLMDDLEAMTEVGDLMFSNVWARPASAGDMDMESMDEDHDMDMDMDSEDADSNMDNMEMATEEADSE
jgi:copper(I)-binding protein